jgi:hypothetical protein
MIEHLPNYIALTFGLTTIATIILFVWAVKNSNTGTTQSKTTPVFIGLVVWLVLQGVLTTQNIYNTNTNSLPPSIVLFGVLPTIFALLVIVATKSGQDFMDSLPLKHLTYLHLVRVPVEIVLFWLFLNKTIPELMTFEGRNFDIIAGITAPLIAYFGLTKSVLHTRIVLLWNFLCLGLLINIVINALFSAPSPFQKFAFDQPNIAILYFPFSWLPTVIVPIVLFGHIVSIRQLLQPNIDVYMPESQ